MDIEIISKESVNSIDDKGNILYDMRLVIVKFMYNGIKGTYAFNASSAYFDDPLLREELDPLCRRFIGEWIRRHPPG